MSGLRNFQRKALEELQPEKKVPPLFLKRGDRYFLSRKEIFLLDISDGIGTCADLKLVNIAVFGEKGPSKFPTQYKLQKLNSDVTDRLSKVKCEFAVFLRTPTAKEKKRQFEEEGHPRTDQSSMMAERLSQVSTNDRTLYFVLSGKKKIYLSIIG